MMILWKFMMMILWKFMMMIFWNFMMMILWALGKRTTMSAPGGAQGDATSQTSEATSVDELIPGISNEVTVGEITTKLPRKDVDKLASVSLAWCHAIRSRKIYDARVRSNSLEWLSFVDTSDEVNLLRLAYYRDYAKPILRLPPLTSECYAREVTPPRTMTFVGLPYCKPRVENFLLSAIQKEKEKRQDTMVGSVTLDSKVYVLWGLDGKVNVLDVAGHRQWKQCADMLKPRQEFGCGAIAGNLYVHGGAVDHESLSKTELYTPFAENSWTQIRSIVSLRSSRHYGRKSKEVFWNVEGLRQRNRSHDTNDDPLEVYDPIKDEWRVVEPVRTHKERMFVAGGNFYSLSPLGIQLYDFSENSWGDLHPFSFVGIAPVDPIEITPVGIVLAQGELLATVDWCSEGRHGSCLVLSRGLSSQNKEITWHKPNYSGPDFPSMLTADGNFLHVKI